MYMTLFVRVQDGKKKNCANQKRWRWRQQQTTQPTGKINMLKCFLTSSFRAFHLHRWLFSHSGATLPLVYIIHMCV